MLLHSVAAYCDASGDYTTTRQLHDTMLNHFSCKRSVEDLLHLTEDDPGYVEGKIFMVWPPRQKVHRVILEVLQESGRHRFEVEIPYQDGMVFRPQECISLSLKGVKVDRRKESNVSHSLPIALRFPHGVVYKYLNGDNTGNLIDTREGECMRK
jgi:hypothetical protein